MKQLHDPNDPFKNTILPAGGCVRRLLSCANVNLSIITQARHKVEDSGGGAAPLKHHSGSAVLLFVPMSCATQCHSSVKRSGDTLNPRSDLFVN